MSKAFWSRRMAVVALGAALVVGVSANAQEASPPGAAQRFRAIKVDVSPLAENGLGTVAAWMAEDLPAKLQNAFNGRLAPHDAAAPTLVVRIDRVRLGESGGGGTEPFGLGGARDNIEGAGTVVSPGGKVVATYPLFTSQIAFTGGPVYELGTERRRVADLANSFAYWLPGQMGL
jgi:hypothetical protein